MAASIIDHNATRRQYQYARESAGSALLSNGRKRGRNRQFLSDFADRQPDISRHWRPNRRHAVAAIARRADATDHATITLPLNIVAALLGVE
jgi:uncharacterized membrane protein